MNIFTRILLNECDSFFPNDRGPRILAKLIMLNGQEKYVTFPEDRPPNHEVFYLYRIDLKRISEDEQGIFRERNL